MSRVIGITGSIAVGKSTVTQYLKTHGYCVLDADEISHQALEKESHCYHQIVECFDCLDDNQNISRQKLGQIVFHDPQQKATQELFLAVLPSYLPILQSGIGNGMEQRLPCRKRYPDERKQSGLQHLPPYSLL